MKRVPKKYLKVWIAFVNINAIEGYVFSNLIDSEGEPKEDYIGAVAYIALIAHDIKLTGTVPVSTLSEKNFEIRKNVTKFAA